MHFNGNISRNNFQNGILYFEVIGKLKKEDEANAFLLVFLLYA